MLTLFPWGWDNSPGHAAVIARRLEQGVGVVADALGSPFPKANRLAPPKVGCDGVGSGDALGDRVLSGFAQRAGQLKLRGG